MSGTDADADDPHAAREFEHVYEDFKRYELAVREAHKSGLTAFARKLEGEPGRHDAFIARLMRERNRDLPIMSYDEFVRWWWDLSEEERAILDDEYRAGFHATVRQNRAAVRMVFNEEDWTRDD